MHACTAEGAVEEGTVAVVSHRRLMCLQSAGTFTLACGHLVFVLLLG